MATSLTYQDESSAPFQLKITSNEDKQQLMKAIHADFLRKVDAFETGLIDSLISCGVLTDSDTESLDGKDVLTTRDRARKLYLILEKLPVGVFVSRVGPVLCSKFPHIIPVNFQTEVGELAGAMETDEKERGSCCLRCAMRRCLRVSTMADLLYGAGCLEPLAYKEIIANCYKDQWEKIFLAFENPKMEVTEKLTNGVREVLQRHSIAIPENLPVSLEHGLPCECSNIPFSQKNSLSAIKVMAWQQADESATSVSVALSKMSEQMPLELLSDGEEADDEDSLPHYPGSEETFSSKDEDFENGPMPSSSDVLSPNYIWDRQQHITEQADESAQSVSVSLGKMSEQAPLELLSDGEEAVDEDSSPHYLGSEETFSSRNKDFENGPMPSSSEKPVFIFGILSTISLIIYDFVTSPVNYTNNYFGNEAVKTFEYIRAGTFTHFGTEFWERSHLQKQLDCRLLQTTVKTFEYIRAGSFTHFGTGFLHHFSSLETGKHIDDKDHLDLILLIFLAVMLPFALYLFDVDDQNPCREKRRDNCHHGDKETTTTTSPLMETQTESFSMSVNWKMDVENGQLFTLYIPDSTPYIILLRNSPISQHYTVQFCNPGATYVLVVENGGKWWKMNVKPSPAPHNRIARPRQTLINQSHNSLTSS